MASEMKPKVSEPTEGELTKLPSANSVVALTR